MITETLIWEEKAKVVFNSNAHSYKIYTSPQFIADPLTAAPLAAYGKEKPIIFRHPSVTTILGVLGKGDALLNWAANQTADRFISLASDQPGGQFDQSGIIRLAEMARETWRDVREQAATIGTHVHAILADALQGKPVVYPELKQDPWMMGSIQRAVGAGLQFISEHAIRVEEVEKVRWSPRYGFIGTGDLIAYIDGKLSVLDFKTGKGATYPEYYAQTGAYQLAYEEEHPGVQIEERWVVRVGKTGQLAHATRYPQHHEGDKAAFLSTLDIWRWKLSLQSRTGFDGPANASGVAEQE